MYALGFEYKKDISFGQGLYCLKFSKEPPEENEENL